MKKSTIGLCIPAFNAETYISKLLNSALTQKIPFDEILVYNDCSSDKTEEVARAYGAHIINGERNVGCSAGKNALLRVCASDYIHFHDADDVLLEGFTEDAHKWIKLDDSADLVIMGFEYRDYATNELLSIGICNDELLQKDPLKFTIENKIPNFGIYKRKSLLNVGGFDEDKEVLFNEDVAFHTKLAAAKLQFRASNKITSINYKYTNSMSASNQYKCLQAQIKVMEKVSKLTNGLYGKEISSKIWQSATGLAVFGKWAEVENALKLAYFIHPHQPKDITKTFSYLVKIAGPKRAFWLREKIIRNFKSKYRK